MILAGLRPISLFLQNYYRASGYNRIMGTREIKLSGFNNYSTIVDEEDYRTLRLWEDKWYPIIGRKTTYAYSHKNGKTVYLHRFIMGCVNSPRSVFVDHIDHNGLNNSRTNLRTTDNRGNQRNSLKRLSAKKTSTYKGVYKRSYNKSNPWRATIFLSGKSKHLGCYRTEIEAARSYNQAAIELFGPQALINDLSDL